VGQPFSLPDFCHRLLGHANEEDIARQCRPPGSGQDWLLTEKATRSLFFTADARREAKSG